MGERGAAAGRRWGVLALAALSAGCSTTVLRQLQAGGVVGTSGALGGSLEASYGAGVEALGLELTARTKFTDGVLSGALGGGAYLAGGADHGSPFGFVHLGMHALQLDVIDRTAYVSAFSPYLTFGLGICVIDCGTRDTATFVPGVTQRSGGLGLLTVGLAAEYDVRFARDGEGFFGLMVGLAQLERRTYTRPF